MKSVGFTGTESGMTAEQKAQVYSWLRTMSEAGYDECHHGCCVGADAEAHAMARTLGFRISGHRGDNADFTEKLDCDVLYPPQPNLKRNGHIVRASLHLIAAPGEDHEVQRSGTWATVRRARQAGLSIHIVYPDGSTAHEK